MHEKLRGRVYARFSFVAAWIMDKTFGFTRLLMHMSRKGGSRNFEKVDERGRGIVKLLWSRS